MATTTDRTANPYEAAARTRKAIDLEAVLRRCGITTTADARDLTDAQRELAERTVHAQAQIGRRSPSRFHRASDATWAVVFTLMAEHDRARADVAINLPVA